MRKLLITTVLAIALLFGIVDTAGADTQGPYPQACYSNGQTPGVCLQRVWVDARFPSWVRLPYASQDVDIRHVGGDMWSGRWFWGRNDAAGYVGEIAPSGGRWPMPGGTAMALVGHTYHYGPNWYATTAPFQIGRGSARIRATNGYLVLQTNDDWQLDNDGGFLVDVIVYQR